MEALVTHLDEDDYKKLVYILTPPTGVRYCRMTRPIEQVKRSPRCQLSALAFNLFVVLVFSFIGAYDYFLSPKGFHAGFMVIFWF